MRDSGIDGDVDIRKIVLVRRKDDWDVPLGERRLDVRACKRLPIRCILPGMRRRGLLPRLEPLLQLLDPRLFRLQDRQARHDDVIDISGDLVVRGNLIQNTAPSLRRQRFEGYRPQVA